jgi:hypothetical protein
MSWLHRGYEIVVTEEGDLLHLQIRDGRRRVVVQVHGSPQVAREWIDAELDKQERTNACP